MYKKYSVKQNGIKNCAAACIVSIMKYYGYNVSQDEISMIIKTDKTGANAYNMLEGIKLLGFDGYGRHYNFEDIISNIISFPIICHTLINNLYHFIVIYKNDTKRKILYVMDPACGIKKLKYDEFKNIYQNTSIVIYPVKRLQLIDNKKTLKNFIIEYLSIEKRNIIKIIILSIIVTLLGIFTNFYSSIIIDNYLDKEKILILMLISFIFFLNMLIKNILEYIRNKYLIVLNNDISKDINKKTIDHLFDLPYNFFKTKSSGEIITRINDLKNFKDIFSNIIVNLSMDFILIFISMLILLLINKKLFMIIFISMIVYFLIMISSKNNYDRLTYRMQEDQSIYNKNLLDSIMGYECNKNLNVLENIKLNIERQNNILNYSIKKHEYSTIIIELIKNIIVEISIFISFVISMILIINNKITIGEFILFNSISYYFIEPLKEIINFIPNFSYIKNTYERINDILIMKKQNNKKTNEQITGDIVISKLKYSYDNINNTFQNINLNIKNKSKYLIYGSSGSGKSTIIKILLKYINEYKGTIKINNINLKDINNQVISNSFTYCSQDSYIESDTLKNNIIHNRIINDKDYEQILKICNVDKIRDKKILRDNFLIEDNGFNISGGEKQKILLARSLLKKSNYIVLDESLSEISVDEEKEIIKKIFEYFKDKTIIYITHKEEIIELFKNKYYLERSIGQCKKTNY